MKVQETKDRVILILTHEEFDTLQAGMDFAAEMERLCEIEEKPKKKIKKK